MEVQNPGNGSKKSFSESKKIVDIVTTRKDKLIKSNISIPCRVRLEENSDKGFSSKEYCIPLLGASEKTNVELKTLLFKNLFNF